MSISIEKAILIFVKSAIETGSLSEVDEIYTINQLLDDFSIEKCTISIDDVECKSLLDAMDDLVKFAIKKQIITDTQSDKEIFQAKIMDHITPRPSTVNESFWRLYSESPIIATDFFYDLSKQNDYIKTRNIKKNIEFIASSNYGDMEITINLSKPELSSKEIAQAKNKESTGYPKCALCFENEGYRGHESHPARQNHRIIRMNVNGKMFGFQFSPYSYYNEHSIFIDRDHQPMAINSSTFKNLFSIVDQLPHYFVGSNADIPRVGGSILSHNHYQGGRHIFPMNRAKVDYELTMGSKNDVVASILNWPMSVIRLKSINKQAILDIAGKILDGWRSYSNATIDILSSTEEGIHNTITPIARKNQGSEYELYLVLRNNRTSELFPDGIFHPHPDVQHIKKENIGLIEVIGLAILPPRLKKELNEVIAYLLDEINLSDAPAAHIEWARKIKELYTNSNNKSIEKFMQEQIGNVFTQILEDAGVFKRDEKGQAAFKDFLNQFK